MTFYCVICNKWFNEEKNFESYTCIVCPKCLENGRNSVLMQESYVNKPYFNSYRTFLEVLTEVISFFDREISPVFNKFEVLE